MKSRVLKAEKEAWDVAEVIAAFDRNEARSLATYERADKNKVREAFNRLFKSKDDEKAA
jgi:hypothetical protein